MCTQPPQSPSGPNLPAPPPSASAAASAPSIARASDQQPAMAPAQAATAGLPNGAAPGGTAVSPPASSSPAPQVAQSDAAQTGAAPKGKEGGEMSVPTTDIQTSHYGYSDDPNGDTLSKQGKGAWSDLQEGRSLALNKGAAEAIGVKPGDEIELADAKGNTRVGRYDDQVPEKDPKTGQPIKGNRVDIYDPKGSEKKGEPFVAVSARRIKTAAETLYPKG